jgi:hypothetical protein
MKRSLLLTSIALFYYALLTPLAISATIHAAEQGTFQALPGPGERIPLEGGSYFTYGFNNSPKVGTCIMRVEIFNKDGKRDTSYQVRGDSDMPSMRGAHSAGNQAFSLSKKGVFLLPVHIAMPGDWEVKLTFVKNGKTVLRGSYLFDI